MCEEWFPSISKLSGLLKVLRQPEATSGWLASSTIQISNGCQPSEYKWGNLLVTERVQWVLLSQQAAEWAGCYSYLGVGDAQVTSCREHVMKIGNY
jgi:hypothetical protein